MHAPRERELGSGSTASRSDSHLSMVLVALMLLPMLAVPSRLAAAPTILDNPDGTRSAVWSLDTVQNLTLRNVTIGGGEARLDATSNLWIQTTLSDFAGGNGVNVTYFPEGSLSLAYDFGRERVVAASGNGDIFSYAANGSFQWIGLIPGSVTLLDPYDWDGDGYHDDVVAAAESSNSTVRAFDSQGRVLWTNLQPIGTRGLRSFDQDRDGKADEVAVGGDAGVLAMLNETGAVSWTASPGGRILSLTIADIDADGFADDVVVGTDSPAVAAYNRTGQRLWAYPAIGPVTKIATVWETSSAIESRIAVTEGLNLTLLNRTGDALWSLSLGTAGTAVTAADFDDDGIMDDVAVAFGGNAGAVDHFDSYGVNKGGHGYVKPVGDLTSFDFNTNGGREATCSGDTSGDIAMLNETGYVLRSWNPKVMVNSTTDARVDGDNYGDCVFGLDDGSIIATAGSGVTAWTVMIPRPVNDVIRIRSGVDFMNEGSYESQVLGAAPAVAWGSLSWNASIPEDTNVTFMTRSGENASPDPSWSEWSAPIWVSGTAIESPIAKHLQVRVDLVTTNVSTRPVIFDFTVGYGQYLPEGYLETEDLAPTDLFKWGVFNASVNVPISTSIAFWASNTSGTSWVPLAMGDNLSATSSNRLRFKADLASTNTSVTPLLLEFSISYDHTGQLSRVEVNPPTWSGIVGESRDFNATGYDSLGRSVAFTPKWETSDPLGALDSNGLYLSGTVGSWRVYANNSDDTVSGYADVFVSAGVLSRIEIQPWNPGTLTAGSDVILTAIGFNSIGGRIGPISSNWTVYGGIGRVFPTGPASSVTFTAGSVGIGSVTADDGKGHANTTAPIKVVAGALSRIDVMPLIVNVPVGGIVSFSARGFDVSDNPVQLIGSLWTTDVGTFLAYNETAATLRAQDTPATNGYVRISVGVVEGEALVNVRPIDVSPIIASIIPDQVKPEDYGTWSLDLLSMATDPQDPPESLRWQLIGRNASLYSVSGLNVLGNHLLSFTTMPNAFGNNRVTLRLLDPAGNSDEQGLWINITSVNDPPTMDVISPFVVHYDIPYNFDFYDYVGDVETPKNRLLLTTSDTTHVSIDKLWATFTYPQSMNGTTAYPAFTLQDEDGARVTTVLVVYVTDDYVPTITAPLPDVTLYEGQELLDYFDLDDYFSDPDRDSLFYASGNAMVGITIDAEHKVDFRSTGDWFGSEIVRFMAIDPSGARVEDSIVVTVLPVNDPPTIAGVPDLAVRYDDPLYPDYNYTFDLSPYVKDPDNTSDTLSAWTSDPTHIKFYAPMNLVMSIHYPASMNGTVVSVTITVSDGLAQANDSILIRILNDWPPAIIRAIPDQTFWEDTALLNAFNVTEYFTDRDGDNLYFSYGNDNILVTIDAVTKEVNLSAKQDWFGQERVTFRATDPSGAMAECAITITVLPVNDAPVIGVIPEITVTAGEAFILDLRNYISDVDNLFDEIELNFTSDHAESIRLVGGYLILNYGGNVCNDRVRLFAGDGNATASRDFSVIVVKKPGPQTVGVLTWIFAALTAILLTLLATAMVRKKLLKMMIEEVLLIHIDGRVIARATGGGESRTADEDIFSAMLTAIQDFTLDSFKEHSDTSLRRLEFGDKKILMQQGSSFLLTIIYSGHEKDSVLEAMNATVKRVEEEYGQRLRHWSGIVDEVSPIEEEIKTILAKGSGGHHPAEGNSGSD